MKLTEWKKLEIRILLYRWKLDREYWAWHYEVRIPKM